MESLQKRIDKMREEIQASCAVIGGLYQNFNELGIEQSLKDWKPKIRPIGVLTNKNNNPIDAILETIDRPSKKVKRQISTARVGMQFLLKECRLCLDTDLDGKVGDVPTLTFIDLIAKFLEEYARLEGMYNVYLFDYAVQSGKCYAVDRTRVDECILKLCNLAFEFVNVTRKKEHESNELLQSYAPLVTEIHGQLTMLHSATQIETCHVVKQMDILRKSLYSACAVNKVYAKGDLNDILDRVVKCTLDVDDIV